MKRFFVSDCEGPISKNDNAFELTARFVPEGDKLFSLISKYDDFLADVVKKKGYVAGSTLKMILPFLKAYDVTDSLMKEFSAGNLILISGIHNTLKHVRSITEAFIVSTSYEHYIKALCDVLAFPFENTYCTRLSMENFSLSTEEKNYLKKTAKEIASMPNINIPSSATSLSDLAMRDQRTVQRLDEIFWTEIARMGCGKKIYKVNTIGGEQKAKAIRDAAKKLCAPLSNVMYVGDSITDVEAFQLVRKRGGLTVAFNGNNYAVRNADVAVLAEHSIVTAILADVFVKDGKERALQLASNWNLEHLRGSMVDSSLLDCLVELYPKALPKVQIVTAENMESLVKESSMFRNKVRGEAIGKLG
ncbi:MAG: HAD hydrolase family protein [Candidatus Bathyarchaeota archaeon]|nr:HAD hydrolase family protein [Candidatus Bathyarchaeota archaeon]